MIFTAVKYSIIRLGFMERIWLIFSVAGLFVGCDSEGVNVLPTSDGKSSIIEPVPEQKSIVNPPT